MLSFVSAVALTLLPLFAHASIPTATAASASASALASGEPRFCDPAKIQEYERGNNIPYLKRVHVYQFGQLTLAGLAVGGSDYRYVQSLAQQYGVTDSNSCTWYLNKGNDDAAAAFSHYPMPAPYFAGVSIAKKYEKILADAFDKAPINMVSCAMNKHFVAMGCNGQRHRGPSVFAMFLSYAGCTPEHSMQIANKIWGSNFVPHKTREAIAAVGAKFGDANPEARAELKKLMTTYP